MASNFSCEDLAKDFNSLSLIQNIEVQVIENEHFKCLDQIILYKDLLFIIDWCRSPCIHVLNKQFVYIKSISYNNVYFQSMAIVQIFDRDYLGVLTNDSIRFVSVNNQDSIEWDDPRTISFYHSNNSNRELFSGISRQNKKNELRCYGLAQETRKSKNIYFIETSSRHLLIYSNLEDSFSKKYIQPKMPQLTLAHFRDIKIHDEFLFLNDYRIDKINMGNNCIHVLNLKGDYVRSIGRSEILNPYWLNFIGEKLYVCERKQIGSIKVYEKDSRQEYRLSGEYSLNCELPYFFFRVDEHFYATQVFGNQLKYKGSPKIFKFNFLS